MADQHQHSPDPVAETSGMRTQPAGRRRFVKGAALGLPAVLTLHSGGLAALSVPCSLRSQNAFEVRENPDGSCALSGIGMAE